MFEINETNAVAIAKALRPDGMPGAIRRERAALDARREAIGRLRIAPLEFPEGEDWLSRPEYTDRKMDVCEWTHRSGANFQERCYHPWNGPLRVVYHVGYPFFREKGPKGCHEVCKHYEDCWFFYHFLEFEDAAAFALETYQKLAETGPDDPPIVIDKVDWEYCLYPTKPGESRVTGSY